MSTRWPSALSLGSSLSRRRGGGGEFGDVGKRGCATYGRNRRLGGGIEYLVEEDKLARGFEEGGEERFLESLRGAFIRCALNNPPGGDLHLAGVRPLKLAGALGGGIARAGCGGIGSRRRLGRAALPPLALCRLALLLRLVGRLDALDEVRVVARLAQLHLHVDERGHRRVRDALDEDLAVALEKTRLKGEIWERWGATCGRNG